VIAGVLLAAGGARRFGSQKLVAPWRGAPLVRHAAASLASATDRLIVVVGSEAAPVRAALGDTPARVVENPAWRDGIAGSLACGVRAAGTSEPAAEAIVVALGDQPGLDAALVRRVIARWRETGLPIVSARYDGVGAHPVLFAVDLFAELLALRGDAGARALIARAPGRVTYVDAAAPMPRDVDVPADVAALDD
jgi:CTP:molybdopterin cytidylyltransferase MocA